MLRRKAYNDKQISDMIEQMIKSKEERWCRPIGRSQMSQEHPSVGSNPSTSTNDEEEEDDTEQSDI